MAAQWRWSRSSPSLLGEDLRKTSIDLSQAKHAFITGGASGLGLGMADALAARAVSLSIAVLARAMGRAMGLLAGTILFGLIFGSTGSYAGIFWTFSGLALLWVPTMRLTAREEPQPVSAE